MYELCFISFLIGPGLRLLSTDSNPDAKLFATSFVLSVVIISIAFVFTAIKLNVLYKKIEFKSRELIEIQIIQLVEDYSVYKNYNYYNKAQTFHEAWFSWGDKFWKLLK